MKILHTADWHIGKKLHNYDLHQDFDLFIDWLCQLVENREIDLILVSGDIFDTGNPSAESRKQFYQSLIRLQKLNCQIILTGGNHDSASMLNAPKDILNEISVKMIGGMPENIEDCVIPFKKNNEEIIICAIPFLRDADLRRANDGLSYEDRIQAVQNGIENTFAQVAKYCEMQYPNVPVIAMGHLFTAGVSSTSESERDIQIGNEAKFDAHRLSSRFAYVALGHIHKPQRINANQPTFYSGSPLPLSFSERKDEKRVLLIDTEKGFEPESISVPSFRKLIRISGDLENIKTKLNTLNNDSTLTNLLEIELKEPKFSIQVETDFLDLISNFKEENFSIIKTKMFFEDRVLGTNELFHQDVNISDLSPNEVFDEFLETQTLDNAYTKELWEAFTLLLQEVYEQQTENL
uniref:exonuclease SbcCD subunit D C-terminal domain-containing protein n=1 Tax=Ornithobacterium rhinotracheale TaxID=28251 RepID=UPI0039A7790B